jgi:hypothetical protein
LGSVEVAKLDQNYIGQPRDQNKVARKTAPTKPTKKGGKVGTNSWKPVVDLERVRFIEFEWDQPKNTPRE